MKTGKKSLFNCLTSNFYAGFSKNYNRYSEKVHKVFRKFDAGFSKNYAKYSKKFRELRLTHKKSYLDFKDSFSFSYKRTAYNAYQSKFVRPIAIGAFSFLVGLFVGKIFNPVISTVALAQPDEGVSITQTAITAKEPEKAPEFSDIASSTTYQLASTPSTPVHTASTNSYNLQISAIGLYTNVVPTYVNDNNDIVVPNSGVGVLNSYKGRNFTLLLGHSASTFGSLKYLGYGEIIIYAGKTYVVTSITQPRVENVNMYALTSNSSNTISLMTCAGYNNSERLIITATLQ